MTNRIGVVIALGLALAFASTGCKAKSPATDGGTAAGAGSVGDASPDPNTLEPSALYRTLCAVCHGPEARGYAADNAPSLVNRTFLESASDDQIRRSILDGRPGTSMAAYGVVRGGPLRADVVQRLVVWLRTKGETPVRAIPQRAHGDPARGGPVYESKCQKCHGDATSRASAVHLANPRFLEVASDAFLGWAIVQGRPGTGMEAWQGKLTDAQIDDVVAFIRSFAADAGAVAGAGPTPTTSSLPPPTGKEPIVLNPKGKDPDFKPRSTACTPPCTPDERFVSVDQVKAALDQKRKIVIIDARPPSDWMRVHIPGAVSIPYFDLHRLDEVPLDGTWIVAYCACPHHLSGNVVDALRAKGAKHAVILDEGILEWHRRGYPVVAAPGVEPPPPRR